MTEKYLDLIGLSKRFGLRVFRLVEMLSTEPATKVIGEQLLCSATAVGATSRAACRRALSSSEFRSLLVIVEEEASGSARLLESLRDAGTIAPGPIADLLREAGEIRAEAATYIKISCRNDN